MEREIEGKEWTTKMVTELSKTLLDLKETLMTTQNKAAEIEVKYRGTSLIRKRHPAEGS